jgi:hypothetical protein
MRKEHAVADRHQEVRLLVQRLLGMYECTDESVDVSAYLKNRLDYLANYGGKGEDGADRMRVRLFKDFAPHSFEFVIEERGADGEYHMVLVGGLLFHGPADAHGSGQAPTFAVTLTPTNGWSIHT